MILFFDNTCNKIEAQLLNEMDSGVIWTVLDWNIQKPIGGDQCLNISLYGTVLKEQELL